MGLTKLIPLLANMHEQLELSTKKLLEMQTQTLFSLKMDETIVNPFHPPMLTVHFLDRCMFVRALDCVSARAHTRVSLIWLYCRGGTWNFGRSDEVLGRTLGPGFQFKKGDKNSGEQGWSSSIGSEIKYFNIRNKAINKIVVFLFQEMRCNFKMGGGSGWKGWYKIWPWGKAWSPFIKWDLWFAKVLQLKPDPGLVNSLSEMRPWTGSPFLKEDTALVPLFWDETQDWLKYSSLPFWNETLDWLKYCPLYKMRPWNGFLFLKWDPVLAKVLPLF